MIIRCNMKAVHKGLIVRTDVPTHWLSPMQLHVYSVQEVMQKSATIARYSCYLVPSRSTRIYYFSFYEKNLKIWIFTLSYTDRLYFLAVNLYFIFWNKRNERKTEKFFSLKNLSLNNWFHVCGWGRKAYDQCPFPHTVFSIKNVQSWRIFFRICCKSTL